MAQKDVGNKVPIYKLKKTEEVMKYYDDWGEGNKYDKDMVDWNYTGPKETSEVFNKYQSNKDIKIWSEKLIVKFNNKENEIEQLNAENSVKIIKEEITATGDIGLYYPKSEILNLLGNVEVIENNNYVKCDELYLDIKNSTSIMKSNSSNRVEAYITNN